MAGKKTLTPEKLFDYAYSFARGAEEAGRGTQFPTFRQAAKRFGVKVQDIEDTIEDYTGDGYMKAAVGFRRGSGVAFYQHKGEYLVEAYPPIPKPEAAHA